MIIQVRLLTGYQKPLWYKVPQNLQKSDLVGRLARVPLRARTEYAFIEKVIHNPPQTSFEIKPALSLADFPADDRLHAYFERLAAYYACDTLSLYKRLHTLLKSSTSQREARMTQRTNESAFIELTEEQRAVVDFVSPHITRGTYAPTLLHGVTGSGKTECYKKMIMHAYANNKTTVLLLPEVTLAVQFTRLLGRQLPVDIPIFSFHSATSQTERRALWKALVSQQPILIIGVHLPILLPIGNLGLIIVDEEHEVGYQEKKHPKINSKEAALLRAHTYSIPIVMGSATPSITSLYNTRAKSWHFFELKKRFSGMFPRVTTVLLSNKDKRPHFWISFELSSAIQDRLLRNEQSIIFLNRRGYSFFVQCKRCTFVFSCTTCSVSLTLHQDGSLRCHYCGVSQLLPTNCPDCGVEAKEFLKKGLGTQQLVTILQKMFPTARIARADLDTTVNKKKWQELTDAFTKGHLDIMVGTQTITKGYDFPHVTLVGVIWADLNIHFPVYNAAEHTLQQLIQVAGRAGRHHTDSEVIIQTMVEHPIFSYLSEIDYPAYYEYEIKKRELVGYPPAQRLVEIEGKHEDRSVVADDMQACVDFINDYCSRNKIQLQVLGPAEPPVYKVNNVHSMKLYLKGPDIRIMTRVFHSLDLSKFASSLYYTPSPLS